MKKLPLLLAVCGLMLTAGSGCKKTCGEWYEADGRACVLIRTKYLGEYMNEAGNGYIYLTTGDELNKIWINYNEYYLLLSNETHFDIPLQDILSTPGAPTVKGSGYFSGN